MPSPGCALSCTNRTTDVWPRFSRNALASLVVLYNPESQTQRHYRGHTDDIECLTTHPQLSLCATGQASSLNSPGEDSAHVQVSLLYFYFYIIYDKL